MSAEIKDWPVCSALRLVAAYRECERIMREGVLADRMRAQFRQRAIVRAARMDLKVWRLFQCELDGFLGGPVTHDQ